MLNPLELVKTLNSPERLEPPHQSNRQSAKALRDSERQLRQQNKVLVELARKQATNRGDLNAALRDVTEAAAHTLKVNASVWLYNAARTDILCADLFQQNTGVHLNGLTIAIADHPAYFTALEEDRTIAAHDACIDPRTKDFLTDYLRPLGITSLLAAPIRRAGQTIGVVCHEQTCSPRQWTLEEQNFASSMADFVSLSIEMHERRRVEVALRREEQKYRSIFENAVEGIFQTSAEGHYLAANPMLAKIYGYGSPDELMNTLTDIEHQLYVDPDRRTEFRELLRSQDAVRSFESQIYRKDGVVIWISENARTIRDSSGQLVGYEGTVEDITVRKQAEAELHKRDQLLQGVAEATHYLLTNPHCDQAIGQALATLGIAANVDRVYIYENLSLLGSGKVPVQMRFEWTRPPIAPLLKRPDVQEQIYTSLKTLQPNDPDAAAAPECYWYDTLAKGISVSATVDEFPLASQGMLQHYGIFSLLMVPLLIDDQFWGWVGFDDSRPDRHWFKSEKSILIAMAASIGGALKREIAEATIRYQAHHDLLTGLPNRVQFSDRLPAAISSARRHQQMLAVLFLDLDRFKTINDTLGHAIGDQLLQYVAERLTDCLREGDLVARWGGDEFTLLLPDIIELDDVTTIAQRILSALKPAFHLEGHELYITSSIGIALYPHHGKDVPTLLKHADAALYRVKEQGRNSYQLYTPDINFQASELLALENRLHHALARREFVVHYQPQVNIHTHQVGCVEALVRWQHPEIGLISPGTFIPLAEENGLIVPIGEWILQTACAQNKLWQDQGLPKLRISVNLSARQFQQPNLVEQVAKALADTGLDPQYLELEITETMVMQNVTFASDMLQSLRKMGVQIAMDDFGSGYSSLAYLKKFPLHTLKTDQSFVKDLAAGSEDAAIISAILTLGRGLNLTVVVEGVETQTQLDLLRSLHCTEIQGYLFSPPLSAELATQFLCSHQQKSLSLANLPNLAPRLNPSLLS